MKYLSEKITDYVIKTGAVLSDNKTSGDKLLRFVRMV